MPTDPISADRLAELLADRQPFHSVWQMNFFITARAGGTAYGCYKQAVDELHKRWRALQTMKSGRAMLVVEMDQLESRSRRLWQSRFTRRREAITLAKLRDDLASLDLTIADTQREFDQFAWQADRLKEKVGELTPEHRADLDQVMWKHNLRCTALADIISTGSLSGPLVALLQATPPEWRKPILDDIKKTLEIEGKPESDKLDTKETGPLIEWFETFESPITLFLEEGKKE